MIKIGILGATGYTGLELLKILARHAEAEVVWLTSENSAGQTFGDVFAYPLPYSTMSLVPVAQADLAAVDLVFACLPHGASQGAVAAARQAGARVVDLSADYRLHDPARYESWYGKPHTQLSALAEAVYGLPELHRAQIAPASIVGNPGCYPTSVILPLAPLARAGWLAGTVIADSKSGVSGAGRGLALKSHFVEVNENLSPYSIGRTHRHLAEIEQELETAAGVGDHGAGVFQVIFSPHLVPINRGIVSTIYVNLPAGVTGPQARECLNEAYHGEPFVRILPPGQVATMAHSVNTNNCTIALTAVPGSQTLILTSSIDNLIKGASGQAIQNMNVMYGLDEACGLR
ncbi:MAG TPA: N-acetyl-gamma-glutamyl-phosphate reductase [Anaerolineae bacterium]